ncbi:hypothetical protein CGBL_0125220 [Corynebacterium glutamicum]|nr:hypothetical protein CGBL_0125220 [Corynebacterium glutamicum]
MRRLEANLRGHFLQGLALNLDSFRGNQWRPDRRDKIGEKVKVLARVSGFQWFKPNKRDKNLTSCKILSRLSGPSQLSAPNCPEPPQLGQLCGRLRIRLHLSTQIQGS